MLYREIRDFLAPADAADLLAFAVAREADFEPTGLGVACEPDLQVRRSRRLQDLGPMQALIEQRVSALLPELITDLGVLRFEPRGFDTELVAHEDGAFYARHIDLHTDLQERRAAPGDRMISIVAYFHREPRGFTGGALRLYPLSTRADREVAVDIAPEHNTAIAFSSWLPHEVLPVTCASRRFADVRFAVNCWVLR